NPHHFGCGSSGGTERDRGSHSRPPRWWRLRSGDGFGSWVTGYLSSLVGRTHHRVLIVRHRRLDLVAGGGDVAGSCETWLARVTGGAWSRGTGAPAGAREAAAPRGAHPPPPRHPAPARNADPPPPSTRTGATTHARPT